MTTNDKILNGSGLSTVLELLKTKIDEKADASSIITPIQSDWAQATTTSLDYIKNKPTLPTNNILSYQGKNSSMSGGDNYYYLLATDIADGTTYTYQVPAYTSTPSNDNQVTTKGYVDTALTSYVEISSLTTVAFSGDYNDLINAPTIPAAQIQADWEQSVTTSVDYIKNKPVVTYSDGVLTFTGF